MTENDVPSLEISLWISEPDGHLLLGVVTPYLNFNEGLNRGQVERIAALCAASLSGNPAKVDSLTLTTQPWEDLATSKIAAAFSA